MEPNKEEGKSGCCGSGSEKCCCCGKAVKALILLLVGGLIGYFIGHCGGMKRGCPVGMMTAPVAATTPAK